MVGAISGRWLEIASRSVRTNAASTHNQHRGLIVLPEIRESDMFENSPYIDKAGVAAEKGISPDTWLHWEKTGQLPPSAKIGRRRVWKRTDVDAWFESKFAKAGA